MRKVFSTPRPAPHTLGAFGLAVDCCKFDSICQPWKAAMSRDFKINKTGFSWFLIKPVWFGFEN
jgi:hypothetical protein